MSATKTYAKGAAAGGLVMGITAGIALTAPGAAALADGQPVELGGTDELNQSHAIQLDERPYLKVADVQGTFAFNQEGVTPNDDLFNIFGTALTSMCSKPSSELLDTEASQAQQGAATYYINIGGDIKKSFVVDLDEMTDDAVEQLVACSCATGAAFGQAAVVGVPLAAVLNMADLNDGVNTVTALGTDGFGQPLPLRYALEHDAMLVYQVNGEKLRSSEGPSAQLWMPETVARYFTRNVADIRFTAEEVEPDVQSVDPTWRNKVEILNSADGCVFLSGNLISFEGVADDLGSPIEAIEFSFDGGETWTSCATDGASADRWVNWRFETSFEEAGDYHLTVRARTADGTVSPVEAGLDFTVI